MLIFLCWLCSVTFTFWHGEHREIFLRVFSLSIFFKFIKAMQMLKNPIDIIICLKTFVNITTALNKCVYKTCTWMGHNLSRRPSKVIHISAIEFWCFPHSSLLCFFHWSWRKKIEKDEVRRKAAAVGKKKMEVENCDFYLYATGERKSPHIFKGWGLKVNIHHKRSFQRAAFQCNFPVMSEIMNGYWNSVVRALCTFWYN